MPRIIPIRDLKKTSEISEMCKTTEGPVFITKNGYGDMVIMSMEVYERNMFMNDIYRKVARAEESLMKGETMDGFDSLSRIREKYGI